jgi:tryptophan halogenase
VKIVIVGGGTAGWLSALYAKRMHPEKDVVLIESEDIGILGAGEGSTPHLVHFLLFLGISIKDIFQSCGITIKNSIKFKNWSKNQKSFFHPFGSNSPASEDCNFSVFDMMESPTSFSHIVSSMFDHEMNQYLFMHKLSEQNRVPFFDQAGFDNEVIVKNAQAAVGIHFDARKLAEYLGSVGEKRGIIKKIGTVKDFSFNESGEIVELLTEKERVRCDFVIDCTGFKRLIIGKLYNSSWVSHQETLPVNSAIPFFLPMGKKIPPYTESVAMNYGWMWKIPTQERYGCGYVFDSNRISEDDAKREIDEYFGFEVCSPKTFRFNAGFYQEIWIKNCLAVGLSAGFLEPLEATSIWQTILALTSFFSSYGNLETKNQKIKDKFNQKYFMETKEIVDFLYLHYVSNKDNNNFWKNFYKDYSTPDFAEYILSVIKERPIDPTIDFIGRQNLFGFPSYFYLLVGNENITKEDLKKYFKMLKTNKTLEYFKIIEEQENLIQKFLFHEDFLLFLKNKEGQNYEKQY